MYYLFEVNKLFIFCRNLYYFVSVQVVLIYVQVLLKMYGNFNRFIYEII